MIIYRKNPFNEVIMPFMMPDDRPLETTPPEQPKRKTSSIRLKEPLSPLAEDALSGPVQLVNPQRGDHHLERFFKGNPGYLGT